MDARRHLQDGAPRAQPQRLTTLWDGSLDRRTLAPFDRGAPCTFMEGFDRAAAALNSGPGVTSSRKTRPRIM
jgi:hypothetical protein